MHARAVLDAGAWIACLASPAQARPRDADFTTRLHRIAVQLGLPGFSAAVVLDGKIVYRHQEGVADRGSGTPITPNTLFGIASVTKSMTGIILSQLEAERKIRLDDPLLAYPLNTGWHPPEGEAGRRHLWHSARISRFANDGGEFDRKLAIFAATSSIR